VAELAQLGESDLRIDGRQVWLWDSKTQTATHLVTPAVPPMVARPGTVPAGFPIRQACVSVGMKNGKPVKLSLPGNQLKIVGPNGRSRLIQLLAGQNCAGKVSRGDGFIARPLSPHASCMFVGPPPSPQELARQILAAISPTTAVSVQRNVTVAGQAAYQLALGPKDHRSLVGKIQIAIDAAKHFPLRAQVFARRESSPALQVGFTARTDRPRTNEAMTSDSGALSSSRATRTAWTRTPLSSFPSMTWRS